MISLIFFVLALVIVGVSCKNLDRGFILFLCFRLILNYTIGLSFIPGLPNLQLEMLMCIYFIFRYYAAYKKYVKFNPLFSAINLLIISVAISSVFTEADLGSEIMRSFNNLSKLYVFIIPIWLFACVFKEKDKAFLAWSIIISIIIVISYSVFCIKIGINPLVQYETSLVGGDFSSSGYMSETSVRGVRWSSIFLHPIGCGVNCVYLFGLLLFVQYFVNIRKLVKTFFLITLSLGLLFVILQTKSRTPMVGFFILVLPLLLQVKNISVVLSFLFIAIIGIGFLDDTSLSLIHSLSSNNSEDVGGSDAQMRMDQLSGTIHFLLNHPILGYGPMGVDIVMRYSHFELFGLESIWFVTALSYGTVGIFALLYLYLRLFSIRIKKHKLDYLAVVVAFVFMNSISTAPDQKEYLLYLLVFLYMRESKQLLPKKYYCHE